ncbi:MAG: hypothetical protein HUU21_00590 [Polyangiaceae bacterium]|nr:hypothetical protein [Polyangiaceae bacterium]
MASTETAWTPRMDARHRHLACTPRGVFVVVQLGEPSWVVTAYRPHPQARGVDWQEADFIRQARRTFERKADMNLERMAHVAAEDLARVAGARPASVNDLWWLASAVGYGRALEDSVEVRAALPAAEANLSAVAPNLVKALLDALDWEGTLDRVARGLEDDRLEELESALEAAEELLVIGEALGSEEQRRFLTHIEDLLPWLPAQWAHLVEIAAARSRLFGGDRHLAGQLWESVADQATGALVRASIPVVVRERATLANELLAQVPKWRRWQAQITRLPARASESVRAWVNDSLSAIRVVAPAPAMGGRDQAEAWEVRGLPAPGDVPARVFVVDAQNPDGYDVTAHFVPKDGFLWRIDSDEDAALVVVVAGASEVTGNTLEEVLALVASRPDVYAEVRLLTPPR